MSITYAGKLISPDSNYTKISNEIFDHPGIPRREKFILFYMLRWAFQKDTVKPNRKQMGRALGYNRATIAGGINSLETTYGLIRSLDNGFYAFCLDNLVSVPKELAPSQRGNLPKEVAPLPKQVASRVPKELAQSATCLGTIKNKELEKNRKEEVAREEYDGPDALFDYANDKTSVSSASACTSPSSSENAPGHIPLITKKGSAFAERDSLTPVPPTTSASLRL